MELNDLAADLAAGLAALGRPGPWRADLGSPGELLDATGGHAAQVDPLGTLDDDQALRLALLVAGCIAVATGHPVATVEPPATRAVTGALA